MPSEWAVSGIVADLSAFETRVVSHSRGSLSDPGPGVSPLSSPLVWGPRTAEVHRYRSVVEGRRGSGRIYRWSPVSDRVSVSRRVWGRPSPHILLGALEERLGCLSCLVRGAPISRIGASGVALIAKHALNDLARPGSVNGFLLHLLVSCGDWGFHDFGGDGTRESPEE